MRRAIAVAPPAPPAGRRLRLRRAERELNALRVRRQDDHRLRAHDAVVHDHRTLGVMGALSGNDWIESRRVLAELAPDVGEETLWILAWNRRGRVSVGRLFGVARDGGPFENLFVGVYLTDGDRIERYEFFDVGDADRGIARFEELCDGTR